MNFENIIGQKEVIESLKGSIMNEKVGHAYIFSGPEGIGKKTVARPISAMLLCSSPADNGCCGECPSCKMLYNGSNPDYHEINPQGSSIGVDEIRKVCSDIMIRPLYSSRKVYLVINAERMTVQAQNSLLKTLEEPPAYSVIILTTGNYASLLETIRSRSAKYSFRKNSLQEVRGFLEAKYGQDITSASFIASYADGIIGKAVELAGSQEFVSLRESTIGLVLKLPRYKIIDAFTGYKFFDENKDHIDTILDIMLMVYRDLLALKNTGDENILINCDKKDIIVGNASVLSQRKLLESIDIIESTRRNIRHNANFQLSMEVMLLKLQEEDI